MIYTMLVISVLGTPDYGLIGPVDRAPRVEKREISKPKWPPVCINILGFKGCPSCAKMQPAIRELKKQGYHVYYWDIDKRPTFVKQFKARGRYPHIALMIDGRIVQQHDGIMGRDCLLDWYRHGKAVREGKEKLDPALRYSPFSFSRGR